MFTKSSLAVLALATGALAANHHNHAQRHQHQLEKKDVVYEYTTTETDITWHTVYVDGQGDVVAAPSATSDAVFAPSGASAPAAAAASSSSSSSVASSSSASSATPTPSSSTSVAAPTTSSSAAPTTLVTSTASAASSAVAEPAADVAAATTSSVEATSAATSAAAAATSAASSSTSSSSGKRGAAYNTASLVSSLTGSGSKISWGYNWGATSDGLTSDLEYVPMLWCSTGDYPTDWSTNAQSAIDSGSKYLLGFNEPDNPSQCNIDASTAAAAHIKYMNPFSGSAGIGAPAVTNSNTAGESLDWLEAFVSACAGECDYDFCPVHWYNTIEAGAADLLDFVTKASTSCGSDKEIWITEFAPNVGSPSDAEISSFLETVQDAFDNNSTYSFVARYSYFYVSDGLLVNGNSASSYGETFAYS